MEYQDLLQSILADVRCPVCGQPFGIDQLKFKGEVQNKAIFFGLCQRHAQPTKIILTIGRRQSERPETITYDDYLDLKNQLKKWKRAPFKLKSAKN
jgi:hypothetical protein